MCYICLIKQSKPEEYDAQVDDLFPLWAEL